MRKWNNFSSGSVLLRLLGNGVPAGLGAELAQCLCALVRPSGGCARSTFASPGSFRWATEKAVVTMEFPTQ